MKSLKLLMTVAVLFTVWFGFSIVSQAQSVAYMVGPNQDALQVFKGYVNAPAGYGNRTKFAQFEVQKGDLLICTLRGTMVPGQGRSGCGNGMLCNAPVVDYKLKKYSYYDFFNIYSYNPCKVTEETHSSELLESGLMVFKIRDAATIGGLMYVELTILRTRPRAIMDEMPKPIWEENKNIFDQIERIP